MGLRRCLTYTPEHETDFAAHGSQKMRVRRCLQIFFFLCKKKSFFQFKFTFNLTGLSYVMLSMHDRDQYFPTAQSFYGAKTVFIGRYFLVAGLDLYGTICCAIFFRERLYLAIVQPFPEKHLSILYYNTRLKIIIYLASTPRATTPATG